MSSSSDPFINLEFLPDWARGPSDKSPSFSDTSADKTPKVPAKKSSFRHSKRSGDRPPSRGERSSKRFPAPKSPAPASALPPPVVVTFLPEPRALQSVGEQIRETHRAYPLFSLAKMFLEKPERHLVEFKACGSKPGLHLFQCSICGSLSIHESGMTAHFLRKHRALFYEEERVQSDAPKGNFTSVARCGLNGAILGPTNHHAYQSNLMQLYKAQFSHLPFERFKQSVVSIRDPEAVARWKEEASWKKLFKCLQVEEPLTLQTEAEIERHFRQNHFPKVVRQDGQFAVDGQASRQTDDSLLLSALRRQLEEEIRFPMKLAQRLREEFFKMGLHVFKGKKGMQFVSIARPKPLMADETNVSKMICAILDFIQSNPGKDRKTLIEGLCSSTQSASTDDGATPPPTPSPAASAILQDLLWLLRQGHVIEYNNGMLEISRPPASKNTPSKTPLTVTPTSAPVSEETSSSTT